MVGEEVFQDEIVRHGGLEPLLQLLMLPDRVVIIASSICISEIPDRPMHQSRLIHGRLLESSAELLAYDEDEDVQLRAASTLFRSSHHSELSNGALADADVVELSFRMSQSKTEKRLMPLGVLDVLICSMLSSYERVRGYGANALVKLLMLITDHQTLVGVWDNHDCILRFLEDSAEDY
ncbi:Vacuolar protein 8 [Mortierella sp. AM989]|nr:Vacuolar protein 8 [Mortierella sp. AM989]